MFGFNPRRKLACFVTITAAALLWTATGWAASPNDVVERHTESVADVLAQPDGPERTANLAATVDEALDFAYLASQALGEHWEKRDDDERRQFMELLRRLLQHNYEDRLAGHEIDEDYTIDYEEARTRDDRAFVAAEVDYEDRVEPLVYRLYRADDGWQIYDLVVDDISLEETYREGYVPIIEDHGWEGLIERMENRLAELENGQ